MYTGKEVSPILIRYDCAANTYSYLAGRDLLDCRMDTRPLCQLLLDDGAANQDVTDGMRAMLRRICASGEPCADSMEVCLRTAQQGWQCHRADFVCTEPGKAVTIIIRNIEPEKHANQGASRGTCFDDMTGLLNREGFSQMVENILASENDAQSGAFAMICLDVHRFKVINDLFGRDQGDRLLTHIAALIRRVLRSKSCASRIVSDQFAVFMPTENNGPETLLKILQEDLARYDLPFEITTYAGIYLTTETVLPANAMQDRAVVAQSTIKGNYNIRFAYYEESMRRALLTEQEIVGNMSTALAQKQFVVYYQPQYNHTTGMLIGAEALVRWAHPSGEMIPPGTFIPVFEKNGFISHLDFYVFEQVCRFQRQCMDNGWALVPISVNFSRHDIFLPDFVQRLEAVRGRYGVSARYIHVELTESATVGGVQFANDVIKKLHNCGYWVVMDDFGSGYSSLNVLKDMELDMIKLDMQFLRDHKNKGGTILSSIVRMAKWLKLPVVAEGVETVEQADFLRSIGCDYIQGYLYARPMPEEQYIQQLSSNKIGAVVPEMRLIDTLNAHNFWDPQSQETLIFSNYVGAAAILDYNEGKVEVLRVNRKYLKELSMNLTERDILEADLLASLDKKNQLIYLGMLQQAIETEEEQECETWRTVKSACCGEETFCIRTTVRLIGVSGSRYLFHSMIRNVTTEKQYHAAISDNEKRFKMASEQVNIYFWEYTIATKEMRPCFRCMRDLGLPPVVRNYPESAFEMGIFPPEVSDMYFDWMRQLEEGVPTLEGVIPLTMDRVPFWVRYTTEFDQNGNPIKAYGSAALVVE